ncbi:MAG: hypothetical protein ICV66_09770, partial [Chitinophagaceae bacterium]|nr:hypothetical protein [Chitinophagaceae bacterium]
EVNNDPIAGFRDYTESVSVVSGTYNFSSRLNLTFRSRHYWNKVNYNSFYRVNNIGDLIPRAFITGKDENYNAYNLDAFFTWDFRLGSRIIAGWKNWLGNDSFIDGNLYDNYIRNFKQVFNSIHGNELTLRFIYFLDYNQLRKHRSATAL